MERRTWPDCCIVCLGIGAGPLCVQQGQRLANRSADIAATRFEVSSVHCQQAVIDGCMSQNAGEMIEEPLTWVEARDCMRVCVCVTEGDGRHRINGGLLREMMAIARSGGQAQEKHGPSSFFSLSLSRALFLALPWDQSHARLPASRANHSLPQHRLCSARPAAAGPSKCAVCAVLSSISMLSGFAAAQSISCVSTE